MTKNLRQRIEASLDELYCRGYQTSTGFIASYYCLFSLSQLGLLGRARPLVALLSIALTLSFLGAHLAVRRKVLGPARAEAAMAILLLLAASHQNAERILAGLPLGSTHLLLILAICAAMLHRPGVYLATTAGIQALWVSARMLTGASGSPFYMPLSILQTTLISSAIWFMLRRLTWELAKHRVVETLRADRTRLLVARLQAALDNLQTLRGLIPICSYCKKVRTDQGYWQQVESYIHERSEATFTHGICPDCTKTVWHELREMRREAQDGI
jgi:hypothetical protein